MISMQRSSILGVFGILVLVLLIWYAVTHPVSPAPGPVATSTPASYTEDEPYYTIEAHWPQSTPLPGDADPAAVLLMKTWVQDTVLEFKKNGDFIGLTQEDIEMRGFNDGRQEALDINYLVSSSPHTISYIFTIYMNTGGAHPNSYFKTFVFDTESGARLALAQLFSPGAPYLARLSEISRAKLPGIIGEYADTEYIADGSMPEEENFQDFFFDTDALVILFPPYQVGPYALGPITLRIPAIELKDLKPQYP